MQVCCVQPLASCWVQVQFKESRWQEIYPPSPTEKGAKIEWCRFLIEIKNKLNLGEGYYKLLIIINMFGNV